MIAWVCTPGCAARRGNGLRFGGVWENALIIFTFANKVEPAKYQYFLQKRTELVRQEIAKQPKVSPKVANNIPSVAIDNESKTTPDGKKWLEELYVTVTERMSENGTIPFFMATIDRIKKPESPKKVVDDPFPQSEPDIELNQNQLKRINTKTTGSLEKMIAGVTAGASAGAVVGAFFGPAGAGIGAGIGAFFGGIASLFGL